MTMKRFLEGEHLDVLAMANRLMFLSQGKDPSSFPHFDVVSNFPPGRVFKCKTCNREFPSFQALGGHRASHKKPRLMGVDEGLATQSSPPKPKTHECSICGVEFAIGQALGGHMRRHRAASNDQSMQEASSSPPRAQEIIRGPVVTRSNSRRVTLGLDLNLTPHENDLELMKLGQAAPMVDCFF